MEDGMSGRQAGTSPREMTDGEITDMAERSRLLRRPDEQDAARKRNRHRRPPSSSAPAVSAGPRDRSGGGSAIVAPEGKSNV